MAGKGKLKKGKVVSIGKKQPEQPGKAAASSAAPPPKDQPNTAPAKMKALAKELHEGIIGRNRKFRTSAMENGYDFFQMSKGSLWIVLGYEDETAWRKAIDVGRSTYFRYKRLAEGLQRLDRSEFIKIKAENADHLIKHIPEEKRYDPDLIKKAQTLTEEEFEKIALKAKATADEVDVGEVVVSLKFRMPESRRAFIIESLKEFQKENNLDDSDDSRVLELAFAELRNGKHVRTKVIQRIPALKGTYDLLNGQAGNLSADEVMSKAHEEIGNFIRDVSQAAGYDLRQAKGVGGVQ